MPNEPAKKILVVDDEALLREIVASCLADAGFTVAEAAAGDEAIAWLTNHEADLMILDIQMPRVDGWGVLAHIATMARAPRVVVASGLSEVVPPGHLNHHVSGYLSKPFTAGELLLTCETTLAAAPVIPPGVNRHEERRTFFVDASLSSEAGVPLMRGKLVQVSRHGFRLQTSSDLQVGDIVRVSFLLPGCGEPLLLTGRVKWRADRLLGAEMTKDLSATQEECLRDLLSA
jgi:CheY-like chemotaxis protein